MYVSTLLTQGLPPCSFEKLHAVVHRQFVHIKGALHSRKEEEKIMWGCIIFSNSEYFSILGSSNAQCVCYDWQQDTRSWSDGCGAIDAESAKSIATRPHHHILRPGFSILFLSKIIYIPHRFSCVYLCACCS